ncbi:MAG: hypothetical protein WB762_06100 [Candidatus Sulfotelmatobacter sp.]
MTLRNAPPGRVLLLLWFLGGACGQVVTPSATPTGSQPRATSPTVVDVPLSSLRKTISELRGLEPTQDPEELSNLFDKIGATAEALFHKMPNLIAHEEVLQARGSAKPTRQTFEYLIRSHHTEKDVTLDGHRADLEDKSPTLADSYNPSPVVFGGGASADLERLNIEAKTHNQAALPVSRVLPPAGCTSILPIALKPPSATWGGSVSRGITTW